VLLLVTGASGSGKSTILAALTGRFAPERVTCAEFDSAGVPTGADTGWRHGTVERWVQHAAGDPTYQPEVIKVRTGVPRGEVHGAVRPAVLGTEGECQVFARRVVGVDVDVHRG
jgi:energy-coupling factor transporter ATP-binding protein EcfA2